MQARRMINALVVCTFILVCLGCDTVEESRLPGKYRADGICVMITLVVNPDHSFVQSAEARTGGTNRLTGKWSLDKKDKTVTFEPFLDFRNDTQGRQVGGASFPPETTGLGIKMGPVIVKCPDSDHEIDYIK